MCCADFAVPETIIFNFFVYFNPLIASHGPAQPERKGVRQRCGGCGLAAGQSASQTGQDASWQFPETRILRSRIKLVPEPRIFTLITAQARSGAPQFSSSKRLKLVPEPRISPRSTGSSFRSPGPFFTLPRHIPIPKSGVSTPAPPPPRELKSLGRRL